ncbi:MAG: hypothetical protein MRQ09_02050 [Candidatus Midichloria sp.]|nr:hypothetical protein [Candidatus Midichloria sp.]
MAQTSRGSKEEYFELIYDNPSDSKRTVLLPDDESIAFIKKREKKQIKSAALGYGINQNSSVLFKIGLQDT